MVRGPLGPMEPRVPFPTCRLSVLGCTFRPVSFSVPAFPLLQALGACQRPLKQCCCDIGSVSSRLFGSSSKGWDSQVHIGHSNIVNKTDISYWNSQWHGNEHEDLTHGMLIRQLSSTRPKKIDASVLESSEKGLWSKKG